MVKPETVRKIALSFEATDEAPHHDPAVVAFRVKKKIFATLNAKENRATVRLSPIEQPVFCSFDKTVIYPVPNGWGKYGWTNINLKKVRKETLLDALTTAYCTVAPPKLAEKYKVE
jgi:predicted DNA-binding protein (MmcQ/YjbR family)